MDVQFGSSQMSPCSINSSSSPVPHCESSGGLLNRSLHAHTPAPQHQQQQQTNNNNNNSVMSVDQSDNESVSNLQVRVSVLQQRVKRIKENNNTNLFSKHFPFCLLFSGHFHATWFAQ
jgi:hypothetical protein